MPTTDQPEQPQSSVLPALLDDHVQRVHVATVDEVLAQVREQIDHIMGRDR